MSDKNKHINIKYSIISAIVGAIILCSEIINAQNKIESGSNWIWVSLVSVILWIPLLWWHLKKIKGKEYK